MAIDLEKLSETYSRLERARVVRNRWVGLVAGGVAVGAVVGFFTGEPVIGGLIGVGAASVGIPMAIDQDMVVQPERSSVNSMIVRHERERLSDQVANAEHVLLSPTELV
jgi:hypothetical protein